MVLECVTAPAQIVGLGHWRPSLVDIGALIFRKGFPWRVLKKGPIRGIMGAEYRGP